MSNQNLLIILVIVIVVVIAFLWSNSYAFGGGTGIFGGGIDEIEIVDLNDVLEGGSECSTFFTGGGKLGRVIVTEKPGKSGFYLKPMLAGTSTEKYEAGKKIKIVFKDGATNVNYLGVIDKVDVIDAAKAKSELSKALNGTTNWDDLLEKSLGSSEGIAERIAQFKQDGTVLKLHLKDIKAK